MKENAGIIAVITVALAFLGFSGIPWLTPRATSGAEQTAKGKKNAKPSEKNSAEPSDPCEEIQRRLQPFIEAPETGWNLPDACYDPKADRSGLHSVSAGTGLKFLIATVPNPVSTHLPLMFDRMIEVIQRGASDEEYNYNSSWFPWEDGSKEYSSFSDEQASEKALGLQQKQPGVITFRHTLSGEGTTYRNGLVVFVVAEQPTGGIDLTEFASALAWMDSLGALRPSTGLRILGPVFSGSLPSLKKALASSKLQQFQRQNDIHIISGSVSSEDSFRWFHDFMDTSQLGTFRTTNEGDSRMVELFCTYIKSQGYELNRVAILSEDETAFGKGSGTSCFESDVQGSAIHLSYPRDIATLRSAYQEQSLLGPAKPQPGNSGSTTSLRGDLSEPATSEHDTVRTYGGQLTPLAQESSLVAVTDVLKDKKIQFIVLRSTNSLDQIFLSQFFRRSYPDARVVIDGSDLLFRRGAEGSSLRGVLILSTYPLLTWQQDWTASIHNKNDFAYPVFGEDVVEGEYIAFRDLVGPSSAFIGNYAPPGWAMPGANSESYQTPAIWVSVIGHHQFWPVAVLNEGTLGIKPGCASNGKQPGSSILVAEEVHTNRADDGLGIQGDLQCMLVLSLIWSLLHVAWCRRGSVAPGTSPLRVAYFAPIDRRQHAALIAMGSLLPALVAVVTAFAGGLMTWNLTRQAEMLLGAWAVAVVLAAVLACRENYGLPVAKGVEPSKPNIPDAREDAAEKAKRKLGSWQVKVSAVALGFFVFFFALYAYMTYWNGSVTVANQIPAYWRSAHLLSGVSPLLPQILLLAGMYGWFWFALRGLALFGDDRPLLPLKNDLPLLSDLPAIKKEDANMSNVATGTESNGAKRAVMEIKNSNERPKEDDDKTDPSMMPMFTREGAGEPTEKEAIPWGKKHLWMLLAAFGAAFLIFALSLGGISVRTLGERTFGITIFFWLVICMAIVLADGVQMWATWKQLRALLIYLDRLPLRRTVASLKGLAWGSVISVSSNTLGERYRVISRQFESIRHLKNQLEPWDPAKSFPGDPKAKSRKEEVVKQLADCQEKGREFAKWYVRLPDGPVGDLSDLHNFQEAVAKTAGLVMKRILQPAWQIETESLIVRKESKSSNDDGKEENPGGVSFETKTVEPYVFAAEEFFVLPYLGHIQNTLGRIRALILGSLVLFVATTFAVASYPFDPMPRLGGAFLIVFLMTGGIVIVVYAQMNRDTTLSYITNTSPGKLGGQFWLQIITFGIGPTLGLLTTLFPSITDFVGSWLQPSMQALK